ncbi:hypothetical protein LSM04_002018 [Trypanosoma melophagium]|uniref:uncharacterized protein n=1 Tax=Trypanosoma melophagium TaxID=715481 RepID=UPI00351A3E34|nr:hypothetical protein LSM04_002018 [Trypanosoma melophagium]
MGRFLLCVETDVREVNSLLAFHNVHPQVRQDVQRRLQRLIYRVYEHVGTLEPGYGESPHEVCAAIVRDVVHNTVQNVIPLVELAAEEKHAAALQQRTRDLAAELQESQRRCEELQEAFERFRKAHEYMLCCYFREVLLLRYQLRDAVSKRRNSQAHRQLSQFMQPTAAAASRRPSTVAREPKIVEVVEGAAVASALLTTSESDSLKDGCTSSESAPVIAVVAAPNPNGNVNTTTTTTTTAATGTSTTAITTTTATTTATTTTTGTTTSGSVGMPQAVGVAQVAVVSESGGGRGIISTVGGRAVFTTVHVVEGEKKGKREKMRSVKTVGTQTVSSMVDDSVDAIFDYDDYIRELHLRRRRRGDTGTPDSGYAMTAEMAALKKRRREELSGLRYRQKQLQRAHEGTVASLAAKLRENERSSSSTLENLSIAVQPIKEELLEDLSSIFRGLSRMREQHYEDMTLLKEAVRVIQVRVDQLLLFLTLYANEVGSIAAQLATDEESSLDVNRTNVPPILIEDDPYQRRLVLDFFAVPSQKTSTTSTTTSTSSTATSSVIYDSGSPRSTPPASQLPSARASLSASLRGVDLLNAEGQSEVQGKKKKKKSKSKIPSSKARTGENEGEAFSNINSHIGYGNDSPLAARRYWADNAIAVQATQAFAALQAAALKLRNKKTLWQKQQQQQRRRTDDIGASLVDFASLGGARHSEGLESISSIFDEDEVDIFTSRSRAELLRALVQLRMKRIAARARYRTQLSRLKEAAQNGADTASMQEILYQAWQHEQKVETITRVIDKLLRLIGHSTEVRSERHTFFTKNLALSPYLNDPLYTRRSEDDVVYVPVPVKVEHAGELCATLASNQPGHVVFNGEIIPIASVLYDNRPGLPLRGRSVESDIITSRREGGRRRVVPFHGTVIDYFRGVQLGRPLGDHGDQGPFTVMWDPAVEEMLLGGDGYTAQRAILQQQQQELQRQRNIQLTTILMPAPLPKTEEDASPVRVAPTTAVTPDKPTQEIRPTATTTTTTTTTIVTTMPLAETTPSILTCAPPSSRLPPCSSVASSKDRPVRLAVIQPKKEDMDLMRIESLSTRRPAGRGGGGAVSVIPTAMPPVKRVAVETTVNTTTALSRLKKKQHKQQKQQKQQKEKVRGKQEKELPDLHWPPYGAESSSTVERLMRMRFPRFIPVSPTPSE